MVALVLTPTATVCFFSTLLILLLTGVVLAADPATNTFTYPTDDDTLFHLSDTIVVSWLTNFTDPQLYLWCVQPGSTQALQERFWRIQPPDNTITVSLESKDVDKCWFNLQEGSNRDYGFNGVNFKLDPNPRSQQTTLGLSAPTSTSSTTSTPTGVTGQPGSSNTQQAASSSNNNDSDLFAGAKAGIGVGVGLAVLVAAGVILIIMLRRRKRRRLANAASNNNTTAGTEHADSKDQAGLYGSGINAAEVDAWEQPRELGSREPQELDATTPARRRDY